MYELNGQVALVTGGARGIGFGYTEQLLKNQAKVCFCDILENEGKESEKLLQEKYGKGNVIFKKCDVTNSEQLEDIFKYTKEHFGKLDIVINNAGIAYEDENSWKKMIDINFTAVVEGSILGYKYMSKQFGGNGGTLVTTSSTAALVPYSSMTAGVLYISTKKAIFYYTTTLGMKNPFEISGVRTLTMCPGFTDTPLLKSAVKDKEFPHFKGNSIPGFNDLVKKLKVVNQTSEDVGKALIHVLKHGESGSAWVIDETEYPVQLKFSVSGIDESTIPESIKNYWNRDK